MPQNPNEILDKLKAQQRQGLETFKENTRQEWSPHSYQTVAPRRLARPSEYSKGGKVKRSGLALVHKGERILSKGARVLGGGARRRQNSKRKLIRRAGLVKRVVRKLG